MTALLLLVIVGAFLAIGAPALTAAFSWPGAPKRRRRPLVFLHAQPAGGVW